MNKDKEWLKQQVVKNYPSQSEINNPDYVVITKVEIIDEFLSLIDQLDEQETLSQEWIDENKVARINNLRKMTTSDVVTVEKLKNLLVPKQDKPVVPQFVADYIEYYKRTGITLGTWLDFVNEDEFEMKTEEWIYSGSYEENLKREYLLIDAIRYGYEVEKEKEYKVFLPTGDKVRLAIDDSEVYFSSTDFVSREYKDTFTEAEIKAIDERYWAFAEEVTH